MRVRLRNASKPSDAVAKIWIDSKILIDASASPSQWRADWMVDPGTQGPRLLSLELDMGLDLIDVTGPGVASYRSEPIAAEPASSGTRVTVRFDESVAGPTPVTIRAICRMPDEGVWTIPSARPSGAIWSGGRTVLKLGSGQVVSAVRERSGRQVNPRDEERGDASGRGGLVLAFQAASALPVADVTLKRTGSDVSAEVRGHFLLSPRESARIEASITWKVERGRLLGLSADLPAGWVPERAQIRGSADPTSWHTEARTGGGMRLVARPPLAVDPKVPIILDVSAVASSGERFGPIELPRIVPVGVRIADEVWIARGEPGLNVAPSRARGLAWLDPASIKEEVTPGPPQSIPVHPLLAWRWTSADGRATLTRSPRFPSAVLRPGCSPRWPPDVSKSISFS